MANTKDRAVVLLSGGVNSLVAASGVLAVYETHFLHFDHGQPACDSERRAAERLADALAVQLHKVTLPTGGEMAGIEPRSEPGGPHATPVSQRSPGTVLAMIGMAQRMGRAIGAVSIVSGASQYCNEEDNSVTYGRGDPQSRRTFYHALTTILELSATPRQRIQLDLPFIDVHRADVIRAGLRAGAPLHLTWSCHRSGDQPCDKCLGCAGRRRAFQLVGLDDPSVEITRGAGERSGSTRRPVGHP